MPFGTDTPLPLTTQELATLQALRDAQELFRIPACAKSEAAPVCMLRHQVPAGLGVQEAIALAVEAPGQSEISRREEMMSEVWGILSGAVRALAFVAVFASLPAQAKTEFEVIDSEVWAEHVTLIPPIWIDSRQVLFLTGPDFKMKGLFRSLAIWNIQGKARIYRPNVVEYCFRDSVIVYKVIDTEDPRRIRGTWFAGKLEEEKPIRNDTEGDVARIRDPINCKIGNDEELTKAQSQKNRKIVALLEGHGYLDLGPVLGPESSRNTPVQLFLEGASRGIELPFGRYQMQHPREYYPFAKAYVFGNWGYGKQPTGDLTPTPRKDPRLAWVLSASGTVTEHVIPEGPWTGGPALLPYMTSKGLVFVNHGSTKRADGIYLLDEGTPRKLLAGHVSRVGVSRDGCMLALSSSPSQEQDRADAKNLRTLKVINLCRR